ncbi:MAG: hypothetical protein AAGJ54_08180, partial [Planctomycetota bacterium]
MNEYECPAPGTPEDLENTALLLEETSPLLKPDFEENEDSFEWKPRDPKAMEIWRKLVRECESAKHLALDCEADEDLASGALHDV